MTRCPAAAPVVVVTVALARGMPRMPECRAAIRELTDVETLASATVICTDRPGTLTTLERV